jgi:hypothetical protein
MVGRIGAVASRADLLYLDGVPRCSTLARLQDLDPIGSAGSYGGLLLIELPLPWPADIGELDELRPVQALLDPYQIPIQAVMPEPGPRRAILYRGTPEAPFAGFVRYELEIVGKLTDTVEMLLEGQGEAREARIRDVLVCTHGRRDRCCGALGAELAMDLRSSTMVGKEEVAPIQTRVWRASHVGGHRFAANIIVLPEATAWAYADADLVDRVVNRRGMAADVAGRYRGCAGLGSPEIQALEREVLRYVGWELLSRPRLGRHMADRQVRLEIGRPDCGVDIWEAEVREGRSLPAPACGEPADNASKRQVEMTVLRLRLNGVEMMACVEPTADGPADRSGC